MIGNERKRLRNIGNKICGMDETGVPVTNKDDCHDPCKWNTQKGKCVINMRMAIDDPVLKCLAKSGRSCWEDPKCVLLDKRSQLFSKAADGMDDEFKMLEKIKKGNLLCLPVPNEKLVPTDLKCLFLSDKLCNKIEGCSVKNLSELGVSTGDIGFPSDIKTMCVGPDFKNKIADLKGIMGMSQYQEDPLEMDENMFFEPKLMDDGDFRPKKIEDQ